MKRLICGVILLGSILGVESAYAWGGLGHRTIARIAEKHLTPEAASQIDKYLDKSIVDVSLWMDRTASWTRKRKGHIPGWTQTSTWHTVTVEADNTPSEKRSPAGGGALYPNLKQCVENLKNYKNLTDSAVVVNLKCVVHMVGDMHCPTHIYYTEYPNWYTHPKPKDPNEKRIIARDRIPVYYEGKRYTYHSFWDNQAVRDIYPEYESDYELFSKAFDKYSPKKFAKLSKGTIEDWVADSAKNCRQVYKSVEAGDKLDIDFVLSYKKLTQLQCQKAGYRLARILNECFK